MQTKLPPRFSKFFQGKEYTVTTHQQYDPDTINCVIQIEGQDVTFPIRALGYDSVEKKQKKKQIAHLSDEDKALLVSKYKESENLMNSLIKNKPIKIKCQSLDLYGRILANIYVLGPNEQEVHVNKQMMDSNLVFKYDGKTKYTIDEQVAFFKRNVDTNQTE